MWRGPMSHGTRCSGRMVGLGVAQTPWPWTTVVSQQGTMQADGGSILVWGVLTWHKHAIDRYPLHNTVW
jgi:hypothetical protein